MFGCVLDMSDDAEEVDFGVCYMVHGFMGTQLCIQSRFLKDVD